MASSASLTEVQIFNYFGLNLLQRIVREDRAMAGLMFSVPVTHATDIAQLTDAQMLGIVTSLGDECLFSLRPELLQCAQAPEGLAASLAAVRQPASPSESGPRPRVAA